MPQKSVTVMSGFPVSVILLLTALGGALALIHGKYSGPIETYHLAVPHRATPDGQFHSFHLPYTHEYDSRQFMKRRKRQLEDPHSLHYGNAPAPIYRLCYIPCRHPTGRPAAPSGAVAQQGLPPPAGAHRAARHLAERGRHGRARAEEQENVLLPGPRARRARLPGRPLHLRRPGR